MESPERTYRVRTYGCQMNVHDSERLSDPEPVERGAVPSLLS